MTPNGSEWSKTVQNVFAWSVDPLCAQVKDAKQLTCTRSNCNLIINVFTGPQRPGALQGPQVDVQATLGLKTGRDGPNNASA